MARAYPFLRLPRERPGIRKVAHGDAWSMRTRFCERACQSICANPYPILRMRGVARPRQLASASQHGAYPFQRSLKRAAHVDRSGSGRHLGAQAGAQKIFAAYPFLRPEVRHGARWRGDAYPFLRGYSAERGGRGNGAYPFLRAMAKRLSLRGATLRTRFCETGCTWMSGCRSGKGEGRERGTGRRHGRRDRPAEPVGVAP